MKTLPIIVKKSLIIVRVISVYASYAIMPAMKMLILLILLYKYPNLLKYFSGNYCVQNNQCCFRHCCKHCFVLYNILFDFPLNNQGDKFQ